MVEMTRMVLGASYNWKHTEQHQGEESDHEHLKHGMYDPFYDKESQSQIHSQLSGVRFGDIVSLCSSEVSRLEVSPEGQVCLVVSNLESLPARIVAGFYLIPKRRVLTLRM